MPGTSCGSRTTYTASRFWVPCSVRSKPAWAGPDEPAEPRWTRRAIGPLPGLSKVFGSWSRQCSQPARDRCAIRCRPSTSRSRNFPCRVAPVTVRPPSDVTGGSKVFSTLIDATSTRATTRPTAFSTRKSTSACTSGSSGTTPLSRRRRSIGPEFLEPLVRDAEVVRDLVDDRVPDVVHHSVEIAGPAADRQPVDRDPVRKVPGVRRRPRRERHAPGVRRRPPRGGHPLGEPEQVRDPAVVLDHDSDVAHQPAELGRDRVERLLDQTPERLLVDVDPPPILSSPVVDPRRIGHARTCLIRRGPGMAGIDLPRG